MTGRRHDDRAKVEPSPFIAQYIIDPFSSLWDAQLPRAHQDLNFLGTAVMSTMISGATQTAVAGITPTSLILPLRLPRPRQKFPPLHPRQPYRLRPSSRRHPSSRSSAFRWQRTAASVRAGSTTGSARCWSGRWRRSSAGIRQTTTGTSATPTTAMDSAGCGANTPPSPETLRLCRSLPLHRRPRPVPDFEQNTSAWKHAPAGGWTSISSIQAVSPSNPFRSSYRIETPTLSLP